MRTRELKCALTPEEQASRSKILAARIRERELLELEKKAFNEDFKDRLGVIERDVGMLASQVRDGAEYRAVPVIDQRNEITKQVETVRTDTGEIIETRAMLINEMQVALFPVEEDAERQQEAR